MPAEPSKTIHTLADLALFAGDFILRHPEGAVVGLTGELGTGKTTLVRAIVSELSARAGVPPPRVTSPTYVLHQSYAFLSPPVDHFDLYRLDSANELSLLEIGYFEILQQSRERKGFLFVEWPERVELRGLLGLSEELSLSFASGGRDICAISV